VVAGYVLPYSFIQGSLPDAGNKNGAYASVVALKAGAAGVYSALVGTSSPLYTSAVANTASAANPGLAVADGSTSAGFKWVAATGMTAPGIANGTFSGFTAVAVGPTLTNNSVFIANVLVGTTTSFALYTDQGGSLTLIAQQGGTLGGSTIASFDELNEDSNGNIAFLVTLASGSHALCWRPAGGTVQVLMQEGTAVGSPSGYTVSLINNYSMSDNGQMVIDATLTQAASPQLVQVLYTSNAGAAPVVLSHVGDVITSPPVIITGYQLQNTWQNSAEAGHRAINDNGSVAAMLKTTGNQNIIAVLH
jgi:hypothetical protein